MKPWIINSLFLLVMAGCTARKPVPVVDNTPPLSSREEILSDPAKAGCLMYVYDYKSEAEMTPAPKGYKPFYITHYGRHGARYAVGVQYDMVYKALTKAADAGLLTERGRKLQEDYQRFYKEAIYHEGELSSVGFDQERTIATRMARRFPEVFRGDTRLSALATPVGRVILSMTSFIDGLQGVDTTLEVEENGSESFAPVLKPNWSRLDVDRPKSSEEIMAPYIPYFRETVDMQGILGRIFTDPSTIFSQLGIDEIDFIRHLSDIVNGMQCLEDAEPIFDGIFTQEDQVAVAKAAGFRIFLFLARYEDSGCLTPDFAAYTLKDIIDKADADIASGQMQIRLRFSHDSSVMPLVVFMDINGLGRTAHSPEEAFEIFPPWQMPMGGNLQLVFFRSRRSPEILLKVLWNEREAVLPFEAAEGPYYRWSDFKAYYNAVIAQSLAKIESLRK